MLEPQQGHSMLSSGWLRYMINRLTTSSDSVYECEERELTEVMQGLIPRIRPLRFDNRKVRQNTYTITRRVRPTLSYRSPEERQISTNDKLLTYLDQSREKDVSPLRWEHLPLFLH